MRLTAPRAPRIGVTTYREPASWTVWREVPADLLPTTYADSVIAAGGVPLLLPPAPAELAAAVLDGLDALVLAGGADVDPALYGAVAHPATGLPRRDRDGWESALAREALARDLPILAICRGMQVLNVAMGGTLIQHLPDAVGSEDHGPTLGAMARHEVRLTSRLADLYGPRVEVATHHHQAVDRLADGWVATAWHDDGTIEAAELPGQTWAVAVQWHPEEHDGGPLFEAFVEAARANISTGV